MTDRLTFDHRAIRASAGTGKTYALTSRYIALLAAGEKPDHIVATTFSRKAAGEIHERVLGRLAAAVHDADERKQLNEAIEQALTGKQYAQLLHGFIRATHRVQIATLDALFIRIATAFAMELQLPPGWAIGESIDESMVREDAIAAMLEASPAQRLVDLLRLLDEGDDRASVSRRIDQAVQSMHQLYLDAPLKRQWDWLDRPDVPDWDRFGELIEAVAAMDLPTKKDGSPNKTWLGARDKLVAALQQRDWAGLLKVGFVAKVCSGESTYARAEIEPEVCDLVERALAVARSVLIRRLAGRNEASYELLHDFDEHHLELRRRRRLLSFDEITRTLGAARLTGYLDRVYYRLDASMRHLLLDEFQDTSLAQWQVIQPIARELTDTQADEGGTAFIVGDTKQAIYGWRGGNAEIFRQINDELPGLGEADVLAKSWRSSPVVIDLVNAVFTDLANTPALSERLEAARCWADDFQPHETHKGKLGGYAELRVDEKPVDRAATLVGQILRRQPHATIGVLTRRNKTVADMIFRLRREGIFASEEGGNPLTDSAAVSVVLSLLRLADHPGDSAARFHVERSPLGPMVGLTSSKHAGHFAADIRQQLIEHGYGPTIFSWVQRFAEACDQRNVNRLLQLVELAYTWDARPSVRAGDFVRMVHETRIEDPSSANVRVMTIHQAKGLEFDAVILPEMQPHLMGQSPQAISFRPSTTAPIERVSRNPNQIIRSWVPDLEAMYSQYEQAKLNDALSMLYVALTRARHAVHMIVPPARSIGCSFAGIVWSALMGEAEMEHDDEPVWTSGDADWAANREEQTVAPEQEPLTLRTPTATKQRRRILPRQSPSDFEGGQGATLADRLRLNTGGAMRRGSIMHRWCELVEWLDDGLPDDATLAAEARVIQPGIGDVDRLIDPWRAMLNKPEIVAALKRSSYADAALTVERERRFAVRDGAAMLTGTIDRMVIGREGGQVTSIDLMDFKTDVGDVDAIIERYRPQLQAYRRAAAKLYHVDPSIITTRLVLLEAGRVVAV